MTENDKLIRPQTAILSSVKALTSGIMGTYEIRGLSNPVSSTICFCLQLFLLYIFCYLLIAKHGVKTFRSPLHIPNFSFRSSASFSPSSVIWTYLLPRRPRLILNAIFAGCIYNIFNNLKIQNTSRTKTKLKPYTNLQFRRISLLNYRFCSSFAIKSFTNPEFYQSAEKAKKGKQTTLTKSTMRLRVSAVS